MKKLLRMAAHLYPAAWRDRYGVEFQALLDQIDPGWLDIVDVIKGGLQMRLRRTHPAVIVAAVGVAGAFVAGAAALSTADRFVSRGTINVRGPEPEGVMPRLAADAFDRATLTGIIGRYDLYRRERTRSSAEDAVERMRGDIGIEWISPSVLQVSFTSSDGRTAQHVAQELMSQLIRANFDARSNVQLKIDLTGETQRSLNARRVALASAGGFGGGTLIGTLIAFLRRRVTRGAEPRADP
jgi:hypothetical protein